ncbi:Wzz/FepE/Etk N-terminal domain-containing protein [Arcobacter porcinus]|uniref:Wzz/FepE/Etk N-terminal domain-containing protein n=1 Tax=Arcobacter porcinus TaxID=1935204 RepID=UPI00081EAE09|nr:Wzz/FepE/Etk N-terminal domain-containing protein [Arcobacter porcinus]OCL82745.1 Tyrosine-protein kinase etk [Arcobacter porcinus]
MQENNRNIIQEDEIDLRELFLTLWKNKVFIVVITAIITILAGIYAYTKTPIYEAKALIEIGEYRLNNTSKASIDNANTLEKKLTTLFIDMEENTKERISKVTTIKGVKGLNSFLEVRTEGISNDEAIKEIKKVLDFVKNEHSKILDDVKKQKDLELTNIDLQISDVKSKTVSLIDKKLENNNNLLEDLKKQLKLVDDNLKKIDNLNPSLAALKLMEKKDISSSINSLTIQTFELESKKDELLTTTLYKLEENKKIIELLLLPHNYKNTEIVGDIMINDFPVKPKKSLIVAVAFVTGFILSIFLVFFREFIRGFKEQNS